MKKIFCIVFVLMCLIMFGCKKATAQPLIDSSLGWNPQFSFPLDTSIEGFWFPNDGEFAVGTSITVARMVIPALTFISFDANGMVAKDFNTAQDDVKDPLYGVGLRGNINVFKIPISDNLELFPSLGVGVMNSFREMNNWNDLIDGFRTTIYGTLLLYKWK